MQQTVITRRKLFEKLVAAVYSSTALAFLAPALAYLFPNRNFAGNSNEFVDANGKPILSHAVGEGSFASGLLSGKPVIVFRREGALGALAMVCTHLGCTVAYDPARGIFQCPCHGGAYDTHGRVIGGPPPAPLQRLNVQEVDGKIILR